MSWVHGVRRDDNRNRQTCCHSDVVFRRSVSKPCIHEGQIVGGRESHDDGDFAPIQTGNVGQVDADSGCNSGDDSDDSGKGALLDNETASSAAMQARRTWGSGSTTAFWLRNDTDDLGVECAHV